MHIRAYAFPVILGLCLFVACGGSDDDGGGGGGSTSKDGSSGTAGSGASAGTSGTGNSAGTGAGTGTDGWYQTDGGCSISECSGHIYECGDCVDNDNDGLIDSWDDGCLGPCDNTENGYYPDLPGTTGAECKAD